MKIKAKVAYKDDTHKRMLFWYDLWFESYQQFIEEENERMISYMFYKLMAAIDLLFFTDCINIEHKKYMELEVNRARGWDW